MPDPARQSVLVVPARDARPVTVEDAVESDAAAWDTFVHRHPNGTVDHLWRWQQIFEGVFGHRARYLVARRGGDLAGVLPLVCFRSRLFGRSLVSLPFLNYGGVLASDDIAADALIQRAGELGRAFRARHVELRHGSRQFPDLPSRQHKLGLTRPLPASGERLWSSIDRKIRNQVRKAQKDGLTSCIGGAELVDDFYGVFATNMRDLGTPVYPKQLFSETLRLFPDAAHVYVVRAGSMTAAAGIALRFRDAVLVPWASSRREFRTQCANVLLYWAMLEHAILTGAHLFDFGRSSPDSGPYHFKVQWGGQATPLHWEYLLLERDDMPDHGPGSGKMAMAIDAWKRLPLWMATALGPRIVRHIP